MAFTATAITNHSRVSIRMQALSDVQTSGQFDVPRRRKAAMKRLATTTWVLHAASSRRITTNPPTFWEKSESHRLKSDVWWEMLVSMRVIHELFDVFSWIICSRKWLRVDFLTTRKPVRQKVRWDEEFLSIMRCLFIIWWCRNIFIQHDLVVYPINYKVLYILSLLRGFLHSRSFKFRASEKSVGCLTNLEFDTITKCPIYGISTYIWLKSMYGIFTIHGCYGKFALFLSCNIRNLCNHPCFAGKKKR